MFTVLCLTFLALLPAPTWIAGSWSLAGLFPSYSSVQLLEATSRQDLDSAIRLQFVYAPWVYELLVPLSSISSPPNLNPEPCLAQPTQICPGPQEGEGGMASWV